MRGRHLLLLTLLTAAFVADPTAGPGLRGASTVTTGAAPMQQVASGRVGALVPPSWEFRPIASEGSRIGLRASRSLGDWVSLERQRSGLEAWWVDATEVGVPSDYYYLAAEGPAIRRLPSGPDCRRESRWIVANRRPLFDRPSASSGDFMATAAGTCRTKDRVTRWRSFVAAPGFGPAQRLGIPESGLYYAMVIVPEGPRADRRIDRLLSRVTFGQTAVRDFLRTAGARDIA